ncbi:FHA domain-containing protein [Saccharopolyspora sp. 5N708]|uniref:FHA domain-containing protein n=1 Tax=Saccharopolyspora sp. 5N708 TaxID=3457424 RepID=UPI003FD20D36
MAIARIDGGDIPRRGKPWTSPGALVVRALTGAVAASPDEGAKVRFGRFPVPKVDVCLGEDDIRVSRTHGVLEHQQGWWWLHNTGSLPIQISGGHRICAADEPVPLSPGYTTLVITGTADRKHVLDLRINDYDDAQRALLADFRTVAPRIWPLNDEQRLVLVVLGQRYLSGEPHPRPLTRKGAAERLTELRPGERWDVKRVDRVVERVRNELRRHGVEGLFADEVDAPVGNLLSHNLLMELTATTETLKRADLALLEDSAA